MSGFKGVLNKNFTLLFFGNLVSKIGTITFDIVLAWWIIEVTGSARYSSYVFAAAFLGIAVVSPVGGVISDKWNKKNILIICDTVSGIISIIISFMAYYNYMNIIFLIICSFVLGACYSIFKPTIRSIIPKIVQKKDLVKANALFANITESTKFVGPIVAGYLITLVFIGIPGVFFINGLTFIFSAISEFFIKTEYIPQDSKFIFKDFLKGLKEGFLYTLKHNQVFVVIVGACLVNFFFASSTILLPLYIKKVLNQEGSFYAFVMAAYAVGGFCITLFYFFFKEVRINLIKMFISIPLAGLALIFITVFPNIIGVLICFLGLGLFISRFDCLFTTYIQKNVSEEYLGRVFSIIIMTAMLLSPISFLIFGYLGDICLESIFLYCGIGVIICCIPIMLLLRKFQRSNS